MHFLEYLFFKYYNWQVKVGNGDMPAFMAVLSISFSFMLYFADLVMGYFFFLSDKDIKTTLPLHVFILFFILLIILFYFLLAYKGKDKLIIEKHKEEWSGKKQLGAVLFPIIAFVVMNIEIYLKIQMNQGRL